MSRELRLEDICTNTYLVQLLYLFNLVLGLPHIVQLIKNNNVLEEKLKLNLIKISSKWQIGSHIFIGHASVNDWKETILAKDAWRELI